MNQNTLYALFEDDDTRPRRVRLRSGRRCSPPRNTTSRAKVFASDGNPRGRRYSPEGLIQGSLISLGGGTKLLAPPPRLSAADEGARPDGCLSSRGRRYSPPRHMFRCRRRCSAHRNTDASEGARPRRESSRTTFLARGIRPRFSDRRFSRTAPPTDRKQRGERCTHGTKAKYRKIQEKYFRGKVPKVSMSTSHDPPDTGANGAIIRWIM